MNKTTQRTMLGFIEALMTIAVEDGGLPVLDTAMLEHMPTDEVTENLNALFDVVQNVIEETYARGHANGYDAGYADGYDTGFEDSYSS